jgi:hypothetical protein
MTKPSSDQLHVAAIWLDCYEGEGVDADACRVNMQTFLYLIYYPEYFGISQYYWDENEQSYFILTKNEAFYYKADKVSIYSSNYYADKPHWSC